MIILNKNCFKKKKYKRVHSSFSSYLDLADAKLELSSGRNLSEIALKTLVGRR